MSGKFEGKAVIVTGSSNGIGRSVAKIFAAEGAKVTIAGRNPTSIEESRQLLMAVGASDDNILTIQGDLGSEDVVQELIEKTVKKFGRIDVLVNNAAMLDGDGGKEGIELPIEQFDKVIRVNVRNVILLTQLAVPHLAKTKGSVVNISSIVSQPHQFHHHAYYSITKAALDQVTVQMAAALIKQGIRVNSVNPGVIATDIFMKNGMDEETNSKFLKSMSNVEVIPIGRVGNPDDIGKVVYFLSDRSQSEYIVGQRIYVDGGSTLKNGLLSALGSFEKAESSPVL